MMIKVILFVVLVLTLVSISDSREAYENSMCYAAMYNTGIAAKVQKIFPLKFDKGSGVFYNSDEYYNYANKYGYLPVKYGSSANTFNGIEETQTAQYFFFDDDEEVSLFFFFDKPQDGSGGTVYASITSTGLAGKGAAITVLDDPGEGTYTWDDADGTSQPRWAWVECCTDGMVLGNLPQPVADSLDNYNPSDHSFCVNIDFTSSTGVDRFIVRSLDNYYELGGRTISSFDIPSDQANSLQLCYTQCNCREGAVLTENYGTFDNKAVIEGSGSSSGIGKYAAGSHCTWIIQPDSNPEFVAIYFDEFSFGNIADIVIISSEVDGGDVLKEYPTDDNTAANQLIWTPEILAGIIGTELDISEYNTLLIPRSSSGTFEALVDFTSIIGSAGGPGFVIQYVSVARTDSLSETNINNAGSVVVTVYGQYFLSLEDLSCQIQQDGEATRYVPATYISSTQVKCTIPAKLGGDIASNLGYLSISNDGFVYHNNVSFNYYSAACGVLDNCATCIASPICAWCEVIDSNSGLQSNCTTIPNVLEPGTPSPECPAEDYTWHHDCCNICTELNNCTDTNGECQCDSTCSCNEDLANNIVFDGEECENSCPANSTGSICSGHGTCTNTSSCVCTYPYRGDMCECKLCVGSGGEEGFCFGNGECDCDGKCTCDVGFSEEDNCLCAEHCEGYDEDNDIECNGNGECACGICYCDILYDGNLCDCAIPAACPTAIPGQECSGHGVCQCDATCECEIGYVGDNCDTFDSCDAVLCSECQLERTNSTSSSSDQSFCKFCPALSRCVSIYDPSPCSEGGDSTSEDDDNELLNPDECPVDIDNISDVRVPNNDISSAALIAAIVGVVIAIIIAILLAVLGKSQGSEGLANFDFQNGDAGNMMANPMHQTASTGGQSALYESRN